MSRRFLCAAVSGAILLIVPAVAAAHETATKITVWGKSVRFEAIDQNGGGMGMGDLYAGSYVLSSTRGGAQVGTADWASTVVRENMPGATDYRATQWRVLLRCHVFNNEPKMTSTLSHRHNVSTSPHFSVSHACGYPRVPACTGGVRACPVHHRPLGYRPHVHR